MMKIFLKFWMLFLISLSFEISTNAKPVPPGSGEGDVPANILLLLDSSASMNSGISGQDKLDSVARAVVDTSDNFIVTQNRRALVGYNSDLSRNKDFNSVCIDPIRFRDRDLCIDCNCYGKLYTTYKEKF